MFKRTFVACTIFLSGSSVVFAEASPYVGGSLGANAFMSHPGVIANLFGGYGGTLGQQKNFYLGGELNVSASYNRFFNTYGLGLSLIPGVMLSENSMIYGRLGLESNVASHTPTLWFHTQFGIGLQTKLTNHWDLRGEYVRSTSNSHALNDQLNAGLVYKFD